MLLACYTPPTPLQNIMTAPAQTRSGDAMSGLSWSPRVLGAYVLPRNIHETGIQFEVASNLGWHGNPSANLRQDNEVHRLRFGTRFGGPGIDTTFALEASARNGGFMDPLVRFWHSAVIPYTDPVLGVPPDGRHNLAWTTAGERYTAGASGWRLSRAEVGVRAPLKSGIVVGVVSKIPIGTGNLMERGGLDIAFTAAQRGMLGPWQLTWEGQHVIAGRHGALDRGITLSPSWNTQVFHAGRFVSNRCAVGVQYEDMDAGVNIGLPYSGNKRRQMTFTVRTKLTDSDFGELSVSENVRPFRTTPYVSDAIFTLAFRRLR